MEISIDVKRRDVILLNILITPRSRATWIIFGGLILFGLVLTLSRLPSDPRQVLAALIGVVITAGLTILVLSIVGLVVIALTASLHNGVLGKHDLLISDEGIREFTQYTESFQRWEGVDQVTRLGPYLMVRFGLLTHIIPRRDFPSTEAFESFANHVYDRWQQVIQSGHKAN